MNSEMDSNTSEAADLWLQEAEIATLRRDMLRFTKLQLRDVATAEDAVQEALSAAYATRERFAGRAQVKSWIFSILRNKIIDQIRSQTRHPTYSLTRDDGRDTEVGALFDDGGYWHKAARPTDWGDPEAALDSEQFWVIFEICLNAMAENTARIFTMREFLGLDTAEICNELGISENNCWVILHRARSRLRLCLEENWIKRG
jgi:RNA polymerase sigma-70 factor (ECF subfamily)